MKHVRALEFSVADARRLLLAGAGLLDDPARPRTPLALVRQLGLLQLDSINVIERAHELALHARSDAYRLGDIFRPLRAARLFEHWTHDASLLPVEHYPHWRYRFERYRKKGWHLSRLGPGADAVVAEVLARVERDGPLLSRDFDPMPGGSPAAGGWWNWKPAKAALEYLWRTGALAVADRVGFQKVYDLASRVIPADLLAAPTPERADHVDWACREALDRLGIATPAELARHLDAIEIAEARRWAHAGLASGELVPVSIGGRTSLAYHDVRRRLSRLPDAPDRVRLLAPFDPIVRDRARCERLFDFTYRFEAFTPAAKRVHGYYVLPVLDGDRLIARADAKTDRKSGTLRLKLFQEPGARLSRAQRTALHDAAARLALFVGADRVELKE